MAMVCVSGSGAKVYLDGVLNFQSETCGAFADKGYPLYIGSDPLDTPNGNNWFQGSIADVQVYNTSLSTNDVQYLYMEGIGGAPILSDGLVGWWPLNGNANDYSGNNNNGQVMGGVTYTTSWTQGYSPP
jgi:hypothetical protein